jgi:hypothetical protein
MDSLPPVLLDFISVFRPRMRAEVFDSFTYLLCGLLIGLWLADSTLTEKPFVRRVASVELIHRAKHLQGQCYVFAAHLSQPAQKYWAGVRWSPTNRSQLRRGQRVRLAALSRAQWRRRVPLADLLVYRLYSLEVAGDQSVASQVALAQLVMV